MGKRVWVLFVAVVVVLVAGFVWVLQPGSDDKPAVSLGNGFSVAEGSELLGAVFPLMSTEMINGVDRTGSWVAHLRVTGNSVRVINRYLEQARRAKYETAAQCVYSPRYLKDEYDVRQFPWIQVSARPPKWASERYLRCEGIGVIRDRSFIVGLVKVVLIQGRRIGPLAGKGPGGMANGLTLSFRRYEPPVLQWDKKRRWGAISELPLDSTVDSADRKVDPADWPRTLPASWERGVPGPPRHVMVPVAGQRFYPYASRMAWKVSKVEEGTRILALVGKDGPCGGAGGGGVVLVGRAVGDRDAALQAYVRQFSEVMVPGWKDKLFGPARVTEEEKFRGQRVTVVEAASQETGETSTTIVAVGGERPWLRIISCVR